MTLSALFLTATATRSSLGYMSVLAFDTHKAVKALKEAGADERLAEAVVATIGNAMGENLATKTDIAGLQSDLTAVRSDLTTEIAGLRSDLTTVRSDLTAEIAAVRSDFTAEIAGLRSDFTAEIAAVRSEIAALEARLYRHLWIMAAGIVGLTVTLVKLLL